MIKQVIIEIHGEQGIDGESDHIDFISEGILGCRDGKYFLSYDEGQMTGSGKVKTKLTVESENKVILQRNGAVESRMEIVKGERNSCFYKAFGNNICIGIYGDVIKSELSDTGGSLELIYNVDQDLRLISKNKVIIKVKEV